MWCESCLQGNAILREKDTAAKLWRCPRPGSCLVAQTGPARLTCAPGHGGALCAACEHGWTATDACSMCQRCPSGNALTWIFPLLSVGALVAFLLFTSFRSYKQAGKINVDLLSGINRIIIQYLSLLFILLVVTLSTRDIPTDTTSMAISANQWADVCRAQATSLNATADTSAPAVSGFDPVSSHPLAQSASLEPYSILKSMQRASAAVGEVVGASAVLSSPASQCLVNIPAHWFQVGQVALSVVILTVFFVAVWIGATSVARAKPSLSAASAAVGKRRASLAAAGRSMQRVLQDLPPASRNRMNLLLGMAVASAVVYFSVWGMATTAALQLLARTEQIGSHRRMSVTAFRHHADEPELLLSTGVAAGAVALNVVLVPILLVVVLIRCRAHVSSHSMLGFSLAYLTGAYRRITAWFEVVRLWERFAFLATVYLMWDVTFRMVTLVLVVFVTIMLLFTLKPYSLPELNTADMQSHFMLLMTALALLLFPPSLGLALVIVSMNTLLMLSLLTVWLRAASKSVRTKIAKVNKWLREQFPELDEEYVRPKDVEEILYVDAAPPSLGDWLRVIGRRCGCLRTKPKKKKRIVYLQSSAQSAALNDDEEFIGNELLKDCCSRCTRQPAGGSSSQSADAPRRPTVSTSSGALLTSRTHSNPMLKDAAGSKHGASKAKDAPENRATPPRQSPETSDDDDDELYAGKPSRLEPASAPTSAPPLARQSSSKLPRAGPMPASHMAVRRGLPHWQLWEGISVSISLGWATPQQRTPAVFQPSAARPTRQPSLKQAKAGKLARKAAEHKAAPLEAVAGLTRQASARRVFAVQSRQQRPSLAGPRSSSGAEERPPSKTMASATKVKDNRRRNSMMLRSLAAAAAASTTHERSGPRRQSGGGRRRSTSRTATQLLK